MNISAQHLLSSVDRPLTLRARSDVQLAETAFVGQRAHVLKDPLTLELFHLTAEEFFLFQAVRVRTTLSQLREGFERRFAPRRITPVALQQGLNQLHQRGLLLSEAPAQGKELLERGERRRRQEWLQSLMSLLSIRIGSFDVTSLIDGLHHRVRWLFSIPGLLLAAAIVLYAGGILIRRSADLATSLSGLAELSQPRYWLLWLATIVAVKVIHELAHALTCKHLGGRCHEIGVLLLAFLPCLYCDVTDVWRIPSKWRRIAVSSAGMLAELVIAALALVAWNNTEPGLLHLWCLSVVMICSLGTLLINANPLLRYDGYYILSDLVEVPNLSMRAQGLMSERLRSWLLNQPVQEDSLLGPRRRRAVMLYAIAAKIYLCLLVILIFAGLLAVARPYRLENLVYTISVITLASMLLAPLLGTWKLWRNPSVRHRLRPARVSLLMGLLAAVLAVVFYWPIERSITVPAVFVPQQAKIVYASTGGQLEFAQPAGTFVREGEAIARLNNTEMELAVVEKQGEYEVRRVAYEQLSAMRSWDKSAGVRTPTARAALASAEVALAEHRRRQEQLTLRAPVDGVMIAPPLVELQQDRTGQLPTWTGSPLEPQNIGCWIEPGTVFCSVSSSDSLTALVTVEEADATEVVAGQKVRILAASAPVRIIEGEVVQVAKRGKASDTKQATTGRNKKHLVEVRLLTDDPWLLVGTRGTAKIEASRRTLWEITYQQLQRMLKLPW